MKKKTLLVATLLMFVASSVDAQPTDPPTKKDEVTKVEPKTDTKVETKVDTKKADEKKEVVSSKTDEPKDSKEVPTDTAGAVEKGKEVVALAKEGKWFAFSAGVIWLLMFIFKVMRKKIGVMKKIPKRVLWIAVPVLSVAAMLLAKFQGDLSWNTAWIVLTSGPVMALGNDFVKRGLLGREPLSPVNAPVDGSSA